MKTLYRAALTAAVVASSGCAPERADDPSLDDLFANAVTFVDLTHSVGADAPWWPGPAASPFVHDTLSAHDDGAPAMAAYSVPEHFGTHFDAPVHGGMGLPSVDQVPLTDLIRPAIVIDVTAQVEDDEDYGLTTADLLGWEEEHGPIPPRAIVLMRSGWSDRWDGGDTYYNRGDDGRLHFPGFTPGAARFLVEQRDVAGIGVDTGSVDPGAADGFPVHGLVNGSGAYHLENLADLTALPPEGAWLIVAPIKIQGGSGGQVRVIAALPG